MLCCDLYCLIVAFQIGKKQESGGFNFPDAPPGLFFRHAGHRYMLVYFLIFRYFSLLQMHIISGYCVIYPWVFVRSLINLKVS